MSPTWSLLASQDAKLRFRKWRESGTQAPSNPPTARILQADATLALNCQTGTRQDNIFCWQGCWPGANLDENSEENVANFHKTPVSCLQSKQTRFCMSPEENPWRVMENCTLGGGQGRGELHPFEEAQQQTQVAPPAENSCLQQQSAKLRDPGGPL